MHQLLQNNQEELNKLCRSLKIQRLYVFGSILSSNFEEKSDIDFLVSFTNSLSIEEYTENYFALHYKLRELFQRNIDIVTEKSISNPYFMESINETKKLIYGS